MNSYKLLTPGPLTTTDTVKQVMLFDHCTWDDDYKQITQTIRRTLLALGHVSEPEYTAVLMQGAEPLAWSLCSPASSDGRTSSSLRPTGPTACGWRKSAATRGLRMPSMSRRTTSVPRRTWWQSTWQRTRPSPTCPWSMGRPPAGILNDVEAVGRVVKAAGKTFLVDAMSTFGGVDIPVAGWGIDFLVSSANKCIQGVPGFSFILANREKLEASAGQARSLALDLYDQWKTMNEDGKWRFTSPTHVVLAFAQALEELKAEGGVPARHARYDQNQRAAGGELPRPGLCALPGPRRAGPHHHHLPVSGGRRFTFQQMYEYIKARGYVLYPGKVMEAETFRVGNIGEIYPEDIAKLSAILADFLKEVAA